MANMFDENGNYNKTEWKPGDRIAAGKLNKIEDALEAINNNDIERHKEADERLDALEEQKEAVNDRFDELEDLVADNKSEVNTAIYEVHSKMDRLEQEMNDGIDTVEAIAHTVDDKITEADASMKAQVAEAEDIVDQGKTDMEAMVAEVEVDLEGLHAKDEEFSVQLAHIENLNEEMFVNVKKYGAKGDGVTDDSEAFRRAFSKGNQIIIPPGKYLVSNIKITEPKVIKGVTSSFAWRVQNKHQTELINVQDTDMFINSHWDEGGNSLSFENIYFKGNYENKCIRAMWDCNVRNCTFENFDTAIYDIHGGIINECKFWKNKIGISSLTDVKVTNCDIAMNEIGIDLSNGNSNHITNNRIEWNTTNGIKHKVGVYNTINNNQFDRNNIALNIEGATDMTIVGNRFDRSIEYHITLKASGVTIVGNKFFKRDITDDGSGTSKPDRAIKLISYENITFVGNDCNTKIFDDTSIEYSSGYFVCEGNYSPNLFNSRTIKFDSSGSKWINMSDIQGNFTNVNGWAYNFDVTIEYGNDIINPTFSVSKYNGITVDIPDKGASSYNVIVRMKSLNQHRVL